ncbi:MAG TPA: helix-turn-helix domain-containing protein [Acidimicrobiales bacterium]|nr:helix-turn-helix domain-containing protein [Acidimicrobiales bacterium]
MGATRASGYMSGPVFGRGVTSVSIPARMRRRARRVVEVVDTSEGSGRVQLRHGDMSVDVPAELLAVIRAAAQEASTGETVTLVVEARAQEQEMTSQEVADLLNVSRPYVVKLARSGVLPHRMVGNRHRFAAADVVAYKRAATREREQALAKLVPAEGYGPDDF